MQSGTETKKDRKEQKRQIIHVKLFTHQNDSIDSSQLFNELSVCYEAARTSVCVNNA